MEHTNKEKQIINDAWHKLMYCADCTSNKWSLEQAFKYERKERKNGYTAKALIMRVTAEFYHKPEQFIHDLAHISQGILLGAINANDALRKVSSYPKFRIDIPSLVAEMEAADAIHSKAVTRSVDAIMKPYQANEVKA
jgi:hypothetical protein